MEPFTGRIAAATVATFTAAVMSPVSTIILLDADLEVCLNPEFRAMVARKPVFFHGDLMKGITPDREGLAFLKDKVGAAGIVSTKQHVIRLAHSLELKAIQRTFLIDTLSLENAIESILRHPPDAVEFMPGLAYSIVPVLKERLSMPIILAGLIKTERDVRNALDAGADAVSMSACELWR